MFFEKKYWTMKILPLWTSELWIFFGKRFGKTLPPPDPAISQALKCFLLSKSILCYHKIRHKSIDWPLMAIKFITTIIQWFWLIIFFIILWNFHMVDSSKTHYVKSVQIRSFFWFVFPAFGLKIGKIRNISPYSIRIKENTDQKKLCISTLFTRWRYLISIIKIFTYELLH